MIEPKTYRKTSPVTAVYLDPLGTEPLPAEFLGQIFMDSCPGAPMDSDCHVEPHVHTLEGPLRIRSGDWLVKGTEGEFWPVRGDIFDSFYEPADDKARKTVWIVVQEDHHIGIEAFPCSTLEKARALAIRIANECAVRPDEIVEESLSADERADGVWMSLKYSIEYANYVTVLQRFMDEYEEDE